LIDYQEGQNAKTLYCELLSQAERQYVSRGLLAQAASAAGEMDDAISYALKFYHSREPLVIVVKHWPSTWRLRQDPRFYEVLLGMGLT
jgi:hypothetical protein